MGLEAAQGGCLKHVIYLLDNLSKEKYEITLITSDSRKELKSETKYLSSIGVKVIVINMTRRINLVRDFRCLVFIYNHIKGSDYDIVHCHSSKAGLLFRVAAKLSKTKFVIYTPHCFFFSGQRGGLKFLFVLVERVLAIITDVIVVAENERREALKYGVCQGTKLLSINNAIRFSTMKKLNCRISEKESFGIDSKYVVGGIGRLNTQKDWRTFVFAARNVISRYPEVTFVIAGDGPGCKKIRELIASLDLAKNVKLLGHMDQIHRMYSVIDIMVCTSIYEGLPYVILESMYYKKPIVSTNLGLGDLLVDNNTAFVVRNRDPVELADRIIDLLRKQHFSAILAQNARSKIEQSDYSFKKFVSKHDKLYSTCSKSRDSG